MKRRFAFVLPLVAMLALVERGAASSCGVCAIALSIGPGSSGPCFVITSLYEMYPGACEWAGFQCEPVKECFFTVTITITPTPGAPSGCPMTATFSYEEQSGGVPVGRGTIQTGGSGTQISHRLPCNSDWVMTIKIGPFEVQNHAVICDPCSGSSTPPPL
jgi:hypothetical protein